MRRALIVCQGVLLAACADAGVSTSALSVVPEPLSIAPWQGELSLRNGASVLAPHDATVLENARTFVGLLRDTTGLDWSVTTAADLHTQVVLEFVDPETLRAALAQAGAREPDRVDEAYRLRVDSAGIRVQAVTSAGLNYGLSTLWQLLCCEHATPFVLHPVEIVDAPALEWRGLMLDSARHFQAVRFIERYIDWMSLHKLNVLHWHLTDDQAWRLEVPGYPRLTTVGAWRVPAGAAAAKDIDPATGQPRKYGGFYSPDDVREVVAHAALRHVTVVPEIELPGHASAALAAYPELGVEGVHVDAVPSDWGIYENVFNIEESTFRFFEDVLQEVVELFPSDYIHIGGDEVVLTQWQQSARVKARMRELGIDDVHELQSYFVERAQRYLAQFGRKVIGWDEIVESELPADAAVMSWRGVDGAIAAAGKGHRTVLSPAPTLYLDHLPSLAVDGPPGRGGVISVRDIYESDLLAAVPARYRPAVLGLQGNVWTEHIRTEDRVAYMTWPRAAAIAELGWSDPRSHDWADFSRRLDDDAARLRKLGIPAAPWPDPVAGRRAVTADGVDRRDDRELQLCSDGIVLALEDDAPIEGERENYLVDILDPCWIMAGVQLGGVRVLRASVGQLPFNFQIGDVIDDVVVLPPATPSGELEVRLGTCVGPLVASLSLAPALQNDAATVLPPVALDLPEAHPAQGDLCFTFTRHGVDPIWAIDWVELRPDSAGTP
jgi:hexosaminidase